MKQPIAERVVNRFRLGECVHHLTHGYGVIVEAWGAFKACRQCYKTTAEKCCGGKPMTISGKGTFDVKFGTQVHSLNQKYMEKAE